MRLATHTLLQDGMSVDDAPGRHKCVMDGHLNIQLPILQILTIMLCINKGEICNSNGKGNNWRLRRPDYV